MSVPDPRITSLLRRDLATAATFTVVMWLAMLFVGITVAHIAPTGVLRVVLILAMLALALLNTASMGALIKRYWSERVIIYREDLRNLDLARQAAEEGMTDE
jgi:cell division protein FtsW (lipid II flippase)